MLDKAEFTFTHSQKRGILLLVLILLVALAAITTFDYLTAQRPLPQPALSQKIAEPVIVPDSTLRLDINTADSSQWTSLKGIGPRLAARIVKYRNAIGGFKESADVAKVYGISPELFSSIKPYLYHNRFTAPQPKKRYVEKIQKKSYKALDINTATAEEFEQLPGIGKTLSKRIVKFRNSLGGFSDISELKRVYYLQPDTYEKIRPYLYVEVPASIFAEEITDTEAEDEIKRFFASNEKAPASNSDGASRGFGGSGSSSTAGAGTGGGSSPTSPQSRGIPSLDLNKADSASLSLLPGLESNLVLRIIKYRRLLGFFYSVDQLKQVYGLSHRVFEQIKPYLSVEDIQDYPKKDINIVFARNLAFYPFIDKTIAEAIVQSRKELGHFKSWNELATVPGLSPAILEKIQIYFEI
ncbi:MAG: helix-hairpin-helix domain-containing protein [Bacteroidota bacterium]